jgi:hypothetical protein
MFLIAIRYCINQDDSDDMAEQLRDMHLIYNNALVTIVAAAGNDSSFGLPGVSRKREEQLKTSFNDTTFVASFPDAAESAIRWSRWMTRAWVYQEAIFSTRRMIFTEKQVYFECNSMHCWEAMNYPLEAMHTADKTHMRGCFGNGFFHGGIKKRSLPLSSHIQQYSQMNLSYQNDILRGMLGILSAFAALRHPIHHLWGVPLEFDLDNALLKQRNTIEKQYSTHPWTLAASFARALCWTNNASKPRRAGFPSWSWTGWHSRCQWPEFEGLDVQENPEIRFWLERNETSDINELNKILRSEAELSLYCKNLSLHIEGWTLDGQFIECESTNTVEVRIVDLEGVTHRAHGMLSRMHLSNSVEDAGTAPDPFCLTLAYRRQAHRAPIALLVQQNGCFYERVGTVDFTSSQALVNGIWQDSVFNDMKVPRVRRRLVLR